MKRRILFLLHIPPPVHGSSIVGRIIKESELINKSFDCSYINLSTSRRASKIGSFNFEKFFLFVHKLYLVIKEISSKKYDLIYIAPTVSDVGFFKDFFFVLIVKCFNSKVVFHLHNKGVSKNKNGLIDLMYKVFFRNVKVIILSELLFLDLVKFIERKNIFVCPNGIEDVPMLDELLENKRIFDGRINILFLSNLIESKGVIDLVEACALLKRRGVNFHVKFVGAEVDISMSNLYTYIWRHNLSEEIEYLGVKVGKDKHEQLLMADVFVFPTYYEKECLPLVILEAMQYGLPIITTREGGIPDLVIDNLNGLFVAKQCPQEIADKLEELFNDTNKMKEFGRHSRSIFKEGYTKGIFEVRLKDILTSL